MKHLAVIGLLAVLATSPAYAESKVVKLNASPSVSELRLTCSRVGGTFNISPDGGGYACTKENCDGEGGNCTVACDNNNNCSGETPARLVGKMTLREFLLGGPRDNITRAPQGGGGSLSEGRPQLPAGDDAGGDEPIPTDGTLY